MPSSKLKRVVEDRVTSNIDEVLSDMAGGNIPHVGNVSITLKGFGTTLEGYLVFEEGDEYSLDHPTASRAYITFHRDGVDAVAYDVEVSE